MNRVFIDMDGVIVDFDSYMLHHGLTGDQAKRKVGAYLEMPPMTGAIAAVRSLIGAGYEVWVATKPPTGVAFAYADKVQWILNNLPELKRRIVMTHEKGFLGDEGDVLIDDRPHKAKCAEFRGRLIEFGKDYGWDQVLNSLLPRPK